MLKIILALLLAFVLAVVGTCLAAWLLAGRIPKDYTPYEPLRPSEMQRPPGLWVRRGSVELYEN